MVRPSFRVFTLASFLVVAQAVGAESADVGTDEPAFHYTLRTGETLSDVARVFRVPVDDLLEINRIADPDRLAVGQRVVVPNAFAREVAALRAERARLLAEQRELERDAERLQGTLAATQQDVRRLEGEGAALAAAVAATTHWRLAAMLLGILGLGALAWAFMARAQRAALGGRLRRLMEEHATLTATKERYREAAAQLELRYQNLYARPGNPTRDVADDARRLAHAFEQGAAQLETELTNLRAERERNRHASERGALAWMFHPVREWLTRDRLKYRVP